jgi:hypothetical protein
MTGFNVPYAPVQGLTPQQLAQIGLAAFRPPGVMGMPGTPGMPPGGQAPGFNVQDGARMLQAGLGAFGKGTGPKPAQPTGKAPLDPAVMPSTSSIDRALDPSLGSIPGNTAMPNTAMGGGSGSFSLLGDIGDWFSRLFSSGAGSAAGGAAGGAGAFFP